MAKRIFMYGPRKSGKKRKSSGGGGWGNSQSNMGTIMAGAVVMGMGLIGVLLIITVFGDLISNTNLDNYTGLENVLKIIPTISALGIVFGGIGVVVIGARGGHMSMQEALQSPMLIVVGGVMVPFLVAVADDVLNDANLSTFTALDTVISISVTFFALGMMVIAGKMLWGKRNRMS